jgi:hypothetical protein
VKALFFFHVEYVSSGLSYGRGYDFGGDGSSENSLESSIGIGGAYGDYKHQQYIPTHHVESGKHPNHKSLALKGLLVPLAGVALLGKRKTEYIIRTLFYLTTRITALFGPLRVTTGIEAFVAIPVCRECGLVGIRTNANKRKIC